jgi:tetratricopeptide (TPR) repeat protein
MGFPVDVVVAGAGLTCLVLGYRLVTRATRPTLGTGFSVFGALLIVAVLARGYSQPRIGADSGGISALTQEGLALERAGDTEKAIAAYQKALATLATPMNQLARLKIQRGDTDAALPLASLAASLCPQRADILDTIAQIFAKTGDSAKAQKWRNKAAALDPKYRQPAMPTTDIKNKPTGAKDDDDH